MPTTPHTPGPWKVAATAAREIIAGRCIVATPKGANPDAGGYRPINNAEVEANARLIAAAPEMLDLLREIAAPEATMIDTGLDSRQCGICETEKHTRDSDCAAVRARALLAGLDAR